MYIKKCMHFMCCYCVVIIYIYVKYKQYFSSFYYLVVMYYINCFICAFSLLYARARNIYIHKVITLLYKNLF